MTYYMFINNQRTALAAAASATATTLTLASSTGLPGSLPSGAVMPFYLLDAATQTIREIVYCTAISGTTLTVTRAQEGTGAQNWSVGDYIYCDLTAATTGASQINPPAQFDNSNAVASTSWVKAAGLMLAEQIALAASTTLTASQAGNAIYAYGNTTPITITLPLAASAAIGDMVFPIINASNYAVTVATQGSDTSTIPNLVVGPGQSLIVMNNGTASWSQLVGSNGSTLSPLTVGNAVSATEAVALGQFTGSFTANGYQKLPSGLIIQWGGSATSVSGDVAVTWPIPFPNALLSAVATPTVTTSGAFVGYNSQTPTGAEFSGWAANTTRAAVDTTYIAIGY